MDSGDETPPLPVVHEALLDDATRDQLFFDVAHAAELVELRVKRLPGARVGEGAAAVSLEEARELLAAREIVGVQLRYVHGGRTWWDTLLSTPEGTRLVRVEAPSP